MISALKSYPAYKDSGAPWLGAVPEHWGVRRIKTLFREKEERSGDGSGLLLSLTRTRGLIPQTEASNRIASAADLSKYKVCRAGELVMNRMQAWSGMFAVPSCEGLVSPDYCVFGQIDELEVKYFEYLFKTPVVVDQFAQRSKGIGSGFNRLYTPDFGSIPVVTPAPSEQVAIVRFLDHADRRIRRYIRAKQKLIKLLEEQKQAIIHRAVTRGLDPNVRLKPSGVEWLGDVPEHWEVWKIGHFSRVGNGSTPSRGNSAYWINGHYPWLNSSYVNRAAISQADQFVTDVALRECHLPIVPPGSVLVAITGQGKTRGKAAILKIEATINQHIAYITPRAQVVSADFLRLVLHGAYSELRSISDDAGSTKGALTCADLKAFKVALPPLDEQKKLLASVEVETRSCSGAIAKAETEIDLLREYRTRLIANVVTGKLDVRTAAASLPEKPVSEDEVEAIEAGDMDEGDIGVESEEAEA
jgi:type I restriction enzyme S subunit